MPSFNCLSRCILLGLLLAGPLQAAPCALVNGSPAALASFAQSVRMNDKFYRFLRTRYGVPVGCKGSGELADGEDWVEFTWSGHAVFRVEFMQPEVFIARFSHAKGVRDPEEMVAALRAYAAERGMHINWDAALVEHTESGRIEEFQDPDLGRNGIVRLTYSRAGVLVAFSLSSAP